MNVALPHMWMCGQNRPVRLEATAVKTALCPPAHHDRCSLTDDPEKRLILARMEYETTCFTYGCTTTSEEKQLSPNDVQR